MAPAWVCLVGLFVFPRRDARRRTRPAPRCPRAPRGPLDRLKFIPGSRHREPQWLHRL